MKHSNPKRNGRRRFIKITGFLGLIFTIFLFSRFVYVTELINRIRNRLKKPEEVLPDDQRTLAVLPVEGEKISVETALNSRCTSDYDNHNELFHWGLFDKSKKLSSAQIEKIVRLIKIPRFSKNGLVVQSQENVLTFTIAAQSMSSERETMMVESGMQMQALGLVCAALGIGMVFRNLGKNGQQLSEETYGTVRIRIDAMKPSYDGSYWTRQEPTNGKPWKKGKLPDPKRDGHRSLLSVLPFVDIHNKGSVPLTENHLAQILWAARGRVPHLYKSRRWGMTIPTWAGEQNISDVYLLRKETLLRYVNWDGGRPTNSINLSAEIDAAQLSGIKGAFSQFACVIIYNRNEDNARALWEIGFQLFNLLLQAYSLDLTYEAMMLDRAQRNTLRRAGVPDPIAAVSFQR